MLQSTLISYDADLTFPSKSYYAESKFSTLKAGYREDINKVVDLSRFSLSRQSTANIVIKIEMEVVSIYHTHPDVSIQDAKIR